MPLPRHYREALVGELMRTTVPRLREAERIMDEEARLRRLGDHDGAAVLMRQATALIREVVGRVQASSAELADEVALTDALTQMENGKS